MTSNRRCSRHFRPSLQLHSVQRLLIVMGRPPYVPPSRSRDSCWCAALDPVQHVAWVKSPAPHTESLRDEESSQIRAANGFLVASDELRHLERRHEPVRQAAVRRRRVDRDLCVGPNIRRIKVRMLSHGSSCCRIESNYAERIALTTEP